MKRTEGAGEGEKREIEVVRPSEQLDSTMWKETPLERVCAIVEGFQL